MGLSILLATGIILQHRIPDRTSWSSTESKWLSSAPFSNFKKLEDKGETVLKTHLRLP